MKSAPDGHPTLGSVVDDTGRAWDSTALLAQVDTLERKLRGAGVTRLASLMDNGAPWAVVDLTAAATGIVHIPLPLFFTPDQTAHALQSAGANGLIVPEALASRWPAMPSRRLTLCDEAFILLLPDFAQVPLPPGTAKITFTSGTTGQPKGVCLGAGTLDATAASLQAMLAPLGITRHLCALPLSVLLENVAGLLAPLTQGASCIVPSLAAIGLEGSSRFDPSRFDVAVRRHGPESLILLPQMLKAWATYLGATGQTAAATLKFVAVGGAAVGTSLLRQARAVGIPAYEGYGLSEGHSVQTLNTPWADRPGSVGRPLPHVRVRIAPDGEIEVRGSNFAGYLGEPLRTDEWWPSGDLGHLDADGYLHVDGRRKNVVITSFGRNVSPEWVESALGSQAVVAQNVVYGDGMSALCAVVWPARAEAPDDVIQAAIDRTNDSLPDYARIGRWVRASGAFDARTGFATPNGRPRREAIWRAHAPALLAETPA